MAIVRRRLKVEVKVGVRVSVVVRASKVEQRGWSDLDP